LTGLLSLLCLFFGDGGVALIWWSAGIVTGISVMLLSFGPGVLFLFAARRRRLQAKPPARAPTP
jgi:hypothetical protein